MLNRTYGIEIELISPRSIDDLRQELSTIVSVMGGPSYTHTDSENQWKVVTDASVHPLSGHAGFGMEVVSPILSGHAGLIAIRRVCERLRRYGCKVNRTCGLHVNFDARELSIDAIKLAMYRYFIHEDEINTFIQPDRRLENSFCLSMREVIRRLQYIHEKEDFMRLNISRYHRLQCSSSWVRHNCVEFRQHGGSIDAEKIINWIMFCDAFLNRSEELANNNATPSENSTSTVTTTTQRQRRTHSDGHIPAQWVRLLRHINMSWQSITNLQFALAPHGEQLDRGGIATIVCHLRQRGYCIRTIRRNGEAGYQWDGARPEDTATITTSTATATAQPVPTLDGDDLWAGIPLDCRAFMEYRAETFRARENAA